MSEKPLATLAVQLEAKSSLLECAAITASGAEGTATFWVFQALSSGCDAHHHIQPNSPLNPVLNSTLAARSPNLHTQLEGIQFSAPLGERSKFGFGGGDELLSTSLTPLKMS